MDLPHAYLAYLSACTTATGSARILDEVIWGAPRTLRTLTSLSGQSLKDSQTNVAPVRRSAPATDAGRGWDVSIRMCCGEIGQARAARPSGNLG